MAAHLLEVLKVLEVLMVLTASRLSAQKPPEHALRGCTARQGGPVARRAIRTEVERGGRTVVAPVVASQRVTR